ncbi:MAG: hypothetical protein LBS85_07335, partial [Clostridiales Family XIII bacterium]|nr:hypothetical protein [Clostridiales Family XIII bacterium]
MRNSKLFHNLTDSEYDQAMAVISPASITFDQDETLLFENTLLTEFYYILSGNVDEVRCGFFENPKKSELINRYYPGEFVGFEVAYT